VRIALEAKEGAASVKSSGECIVGCLGVGRVGFDEEVNVLRKAGGSTFQPLIAYAV
jgi:hypothetical protein